MPAEARRKNLEGTVHAHMMINEKGNVTEVKIIESSNKVFDRSVVNGLSQCKFRPSGDAYIGDIEIEFKLQ
jgi:protein TonB